MKKWTKLKKTVMALTLTAVGILGLGSYDLLSSTKFPKPSGPYSVASEGLELIDTSRLEFYTPNPDDHRRLLIQIYYPAIIPENAQRITYSPAPKELEEGLVKAFNVPALLVKRISRSVTQFYEANNTKAETGNFPVLIFSHGWDGSRFQNSYQLGELVSHGYVVVSIEHVHNASGSLFKDGQKGGIVPLSQMQDTAYATSAIDVWTKDQQFVLDKLAEFKKDPSKPYGKQMDLSRVGVFGHSFGGATSATTLTLDKRFKAGINMDGFYFGNAYKIGFEQPFMEIRADIKPTEEMTDKDLKEWKISRSYYQYLMFDEWEKRIAMLAKNGAYSYQVKDANHMSFSDFSYLLPFSFITAPKRDEHHRITNELVLSFFNKYLKDSSSTVGVKKELEPLLKNASYMRKTN